MLSAEQLTGRVHSHVQECAEPRCILHPQALVGFQRLRAAAADAGIDLIAVSSFRDFQHQLRIWNGKFRGERALLDATGKPLDALGLDEEARVRAILLWSALPGASRHHWGTDFDVIDRAALPAGSTPQLEPSEYAPGGIFERLGAWLAQHAAVHGFFRPYDQDRGGVQPEPWHLSYAPLSGSALPTLTLEILREAIDGSDLGGLTVVQRLLPEIHARYVQTVATPSAQALRAAVH